MKKIIVICGPTASGKTDLAHHWAKNNRGQIVNGDSRQIYKQIPIITASPAKSLQEELPYHLYNFLDIKQEFSVVKYVLLAVEAIKQISNQGNLPIIVGGTGMYINALLCGYSQIPAISPEIREHSQKLQAKIGQKEFFRQLTILDPLVQNNLNASDKQRSLRAFEVFSQTNQSIFTFQAVKALSPLADFDFRIFFLCPDRQLLYLACNERLKKIFSQGAIDEVKMIKNNISNGNSSNLRAIGMQEIMAYLANKISLNEAIELAQNKTRQYAKRQVTWFKNQIKDKITLEYSTREQFKQLIAKNQLNVQIG